MYLSKNNIVVPLGEEYALLNPLSGSLDLLDAREYQWLQALAQGGGSNGIDSEFLDHLSARGYLYEHRLQEEQTLLRELARFERETAATQVQLLLIPTYACNLACNYCYQRGIPSRKEDLISPEVIDSFFALAASQFSNDPRRPYLTLYGGEPLIDNPAQKQAVAAIAAACAAADLELAVVTNGLDLSAYLEILTQAKIKEIQVTLDGSPAMHDRRRPLAGGGGSFRQIVAGLEQAVAKRLPINLRVVADTENMTDLVNLAGLLEAKGWLDLEPQLFKTQIGRNYQLFACPPRPERLLSQVELWAQFSSLSHIYPLLQKFHRPDFKGIRHLVDTGALCPASFDTCPAGKSEWVFDLYGDIYGCTAACGREQFKLGTFHPGFSLRETVREWQQRSVLSIPECRDCRYKLICGGGCGVLAANRTGRVLAPDCRPVQELLALGVDYYRKEIQRLASME